MTYEALAQFAQQGGSLYFAIMFALVLVYAFWPSNKAGFEKAASMPLDKSHDDAPISVEK